jgi:hypothetical protein
MTSPVDLSRVTPTREMIGQDESETKLLFEMAERAEAYVRSFKWRPSITERFLGCGVGGVVAVFLFRFTTKINGTDDLLWVVEGDVPSAYLVTDGAPDAASALSVYCDLMEAWAHAVLGGSSLDKAFPVAVPATPDHANMLLSRTRFIREQILPNCSGL